jgi:hypothetical protein
LVEPAQFSIAIEQRLCDIKIEFSLSVSCSGYETNKKKKRGFEWNNSRS